MSQEACQVEQDGRRPCNGIFFISIKRSPIAAKPSDALASKQWSGSTNEYSPSFPALNIDVIQQAEMASQTRHQQCKLAAAQAGLFPDDCSRSDQDNDSRIAIHVTTTSLEDTR
jgi:hypothetical protein